MNTDKVANLLATTTQPSKQEPPAQLVVSSARALPMYLDDLLRDDLEKLDTTQELAPPRVEPLNKEITDSATVETIEAPSIGVVEETLVTPAKAVCSPIIEKLSTTDAPFPCLIFEVEEYSFGVVLEQLDYVVESDLKLTILPGQVSWLMGVLRKRGRNIKLIDLPNYFDQTNSKSSMVKLVKNSKNLIKVLVLVGNPWGIPVSAMKETVNIRPNQIQWHPGDNGRTWIAGTLKEQMCPLLDLFKLGNSLDQQVTPVPKLRSGN